MPFRGSAYFQAMNTKGVRVIISSLPCNDLLNMHIIVIPYTKILERNLTSVAPVAEHEYIHGHIVSLSPSSITVNELTQSTTSKAASPPRRIPFDYAIYALGSHLPAPINLWGPVPSQSIGSSTVEQPVSSINGYSGFKPEGIEWLQKHQAVVKKSESILVVGGGALGIREC